MKSILIIFALFLFFDSLAFATGGFNSRLGGNRCANQSSSVSFTSTLIRIDPEGTANIPYQVTLASPLNCPLKVYIKTHGIATMGTHYTTIPETITIPRGSTVFNGTYSLINVTSGNNIDRTLSISLSGTSIKNVSIGANKQIQQWIEDTGNAKYQGYDRYVQIAAGGTANSHSCGINFYGQLKCWGSNTDGRLGDGSTTTRTTPAEIQFGIKYADVSASNTGTCAVTEVGRLQCWGAGPLGDGGSSPSSSPVVIDSGVTYSLVSTAQSTSCGITTGGVLKCWGNNSASGVIGDGTTTNRLSPIVIDGGESYMRISRGSGHTCGVTSSNVLKCWGLNSSGQLGLGNTSDALSPAVVDGGTNYIWVGTGENHTCAVTDSNVLKCWGGNTFGQVGDATSGSDRLSPVVIDSGVSYSRVGLSQSGSCAITSLGVLKCWGKNDIGQVGDSTSGSNKTTPVIIDASFSFENLSQAADANHTCAVTNHKLLKCWGANDVSQLGDNTTVTSTSPISIDPLPDGALLNFSGFCGVTTDASLRCWGVRAGNGVVGPVVLPQIMDSSTKYLMTSNSDNNRWNSGRRCGITTTNDLKCWGPVRGTSTGSDLLPQIVDPGVKYRFVDVSRGSSADMSCGITTTGILKCWGTTAWVGNGSLSTVATPTVIDSGTSYVNVQLSGSHGCGLTNTGIIKCWGANNLQQLGDGTTNNSGSPIVFDSGTLYRAVSVANDSTCGITMAGRLRCAGNGSPHNSSNLLLPTDLDVTNTYLQYSHVCGLLTNRELRCSRNYFSIFSIATNLFGLDPGLTYYSLTDDGMCFLNSARSPQCVRNDAYTLSDGNQAGLKLVEREVSKVSVGYVNSGNAGSSCIIKKDGRAMCSGNAGNILGDGLNTRRNVYTSVFSNATFKEIASGGGYGNSAHCGITVAGLLYCWGNVTSVTQNASTTSPIRLIDPGVSYQSVGVGLDWACAVTTAGVLKCWGNNSNGVLGDGTTTFRATPTVIDPGVSYFKVSTGNQYSKVQCAITSLGVLKCWGLNADGQVGDGTTTERQSPVIVDPGTSYIDITSTGSVSCGITSLGVLKCWGNALSSQLTVGIQTSYTPVEVVDPGVTYKKVHATSLNRCGITVNDDLKCYGYGGYMANGASPSSSNSPQVIDSGTKYKDVTLSMEMICAVTLNDELKCDGTDNNLRIGDGNFRGTGFTTWVPNFRHP